MTHPKADGPDALKREVFEEMTGFAYGPDFLGPKQREFSEIIDHLAQRGMIVPDGWVAVPREPTEEMKDAAWKESHPHVHVDNENSQRVGVKNEHAREFKAMIAAAPKMEGME